MSQFLANSAVVTILTDMLLGVTGHLTTSDRDRLEDTLREISAERADVAKAMFRD